MSEKSLGQRMRALAEEVERARAEGGRPESYPILALAEEVDALEELAAAAVAWYRACGEWGPMGVDGTPLGDLATRVERLERVRSQR